MLDLRGRCLLASASGLPEASGRAHRIREAEKSASRMERELTPWGNALAHVLRARIAAARGKEGEELEWLRFARRELESNQMALHEAAVRRRCGEIRSAVEGAREVEEADVWMRRQGIDHPERMGALLVPGSGAGRP
jgi:hypothetical protein